MSNAALKFLYDHEVENIVFRVEEAEKKGHFEGFDYEAIREDAEIAKADANEELRNRGIGWPPRETDETIS